VQGRSVIPAFGVAIADDQRARHSIAPQKNPKFEYRNPTSNDVDFLQLRGSGFPAAKIEAESLSHKTILHYR
jgi:hypothetical protein